MWFTELEIILAHLIKYPFINLFHLFIYLLKLWKWYGLGVKNRHGNLISQCEETNHNGHGSQAQEKLCFCYTLPSPSAFNFSLFLLIFFFLFRFILPIEVPASPQAEQIKHQYTSNMPLKSFDCWGLCNSIEGWHNHG